MIIIPAEVEDTVDHHAMQFVREWDMKGCGVFPHPVEADIDFRDDGIGVEGKGDDVRVVIMAQMGLVDFEEKRIGTKNIVNAGQLIPFRFNGRCDPMGPAVRIGDIKLYIMASKINPGGFFTGVRPEGGQIFHINCTVRPWSRKWISSVSCFIKNTPRPPSISKRSWLVGSGR